MRLLNKFLSTIAACALVLFAGHASARDWETIKKSGTIVIVTEGAYYPFNYFEGTTLTGFEKDLAEEVLKVMGVKPDWRVVPFDAQLASIRQGRFDMAIASHGFTEERAKSVDFANPHYCSGAQIVSYAGGPKTVAELKGKSVGVQIATTYYDAAKKVDGIGEIKTYKDETANFSALQSHKYDAWITDKFVAKATLAKNPDVKVSMGDMVFVERDAAITMKNNKELLEQWNAALATIIKDGKYAELSKKYFGQDISCK